MDEHIDSILKTYQTSFTDKIYSEENNDVDILMNIFRLSPELKRENRQYWGRELGFCWQKIIICVCSQYCSNYADGLREDSKALCDLVVGNYAIEIKYRIGSGDAKFQREIKETSNQLKGKGYTPIMLILREDNLPTAMAACEKGGWDVHIGENVFLFIESISKFDLKKSLMGKAGNFPVIR